MAVAVAADRLGARFVAEDRASPGTVPVGSVEYCGPLFGPHPRLFYPEFLAHYLSRWMMCVDGPLPLGAPLFAKDALHWKSDWVSRVVPAGTRLPAGRWWLSRPVRFVDEWRYYVADGSVVAAGWYDGTNEEAPAPGLDVDWPPDFGGAVDIGRLDNGRLELVECHAPFGCGWYGEDHTDYALWQALAWDNREWWKNQRQNDYD